MTKRTLESARDQAQREWELEPARRALLKWFDRYGRALPWRDDPNPYRVWVSEIMLQQTTTQTVAGYFDRFLTQFPNASALARADEADVLKAWQGLGYYRRARAMRDAAKIVVERYNGELPGAREELEALPGIGRYAAGAILSFGFDRRAPILEANTTRLHARLLALEDDPTNQIILLLNRRGYSTHIQCPSCGETLKCPNCDVALTHHITQQIAICHYCDYQIPAPKECPYCGFAGIKYGGFGTQKLEQEFSARFPNAPILRMDSDTTQAKDAHERALEAFRRGDYRVLLGTQMIAKGLDFPNVVLVGIVNADAALYLPDFRAPERVFNLILQAAGRAGRGDKEGKVVVQSYCPDHPAIVAAIQGDYVGFAEAELASRRTLGYPPFLSAVRFVIRGPDEEETREFSFELAKAFKRAVYDVNLEKGYDQNNPPAPVEEEVTRDASGRSFVSLRGPRRPRPPLLVRALGPAPAPFAKLRGAYRYHLQTMGAPGDLLREAARRVIEARDLKRPRDVQWIVDVDPLDTL